MTSLFFSIILIALFHFDAHASPRKQQPRATPAQALTTLRAERPQTLFSGRAGQLESRFISVVVRNVGSSEAKQISASIEVEPGLAIPLKGPKNLLPKSSGLFSTSQRLPGALYRAPRVVLRCSSCRRGW